MDEKRKTQWKFSLVYLLISIAIFTALQFFSLSSTGPEQASYSEFLKAVNAKQVAEANIGESKIQWTRKDNGKSFITTRIPGIDNSPIIEQLQADGADFSGSIPSTLWITLLSIFGPIFLLGLLWFFVIRRVGNRQQFLDLGRSKARIYSKTSTDLTFADIADVEEAKAELEEIVDILRNPAKYQSLGGKIPKGVLLMGPPGTGKTLLARATAGEAGVPFFSISGSEFVEMFVGVGAARMRDLFEQAKRSAPDIVFIDEIDTIGKVRSDAAAVGGHEEREQTLDQLLTEMDGFDPSLGVIIMAATNRPDVLDPALLRPGRFDRQVVVDRPDMAGREEILKVHARKIILAPDVDFHVIASRTPGFVGADLANVVNEAALLASRHGKEAVGMAEFDEAIDRAVSGLERKSRIISEQEKEIVSYHEMGHALVALQLPYADPVQKVTIVPRGVAALGMTLQLPLQDKYLFLKEELEDRIAVSLGGRASEEVRFGCVTTGAHNDLITATQLARRMVREFGMSEKLGLIAFGDDRNAVSARLSFGGSEKEYSEETARLIDEEIKAIIDSNHTRAVKVLEGNKEILEILSKELMEKETISGAELKQRFESLKREAALSLATNC